MWFWEYWKKVFSLSWSKAWKWFGAREVLFNLVVSAVATFFIAMPTSFRDISWREAMITAIISLCLYLAVFAIFIIKEPAEIDKEKQAEASNLNKKIDKYEKQISRKNIKPNWRNIHFCEWNKWLDESEVKGGIRIENRKTEDNIEQCSVEIVEIYNETELGQYNPSQADLPRTAGWEIDGEVLYGETNIDFGKQRQLALVFETWLISGSEYYVIRGKNDFEHPIGSGETYFVEVEISGIINDISLRPLRKFVTVYFDGRKTSVENVSSDLPIEK